MPDFGVGVTDTAPGTGIVDVRTRQRSDLSGTPVEQYVIPLEEQIPTYTYMRSTFRIPARAVASQPLSAIINGSTNPAGTLMRLISCLVDYETIVAKVVLNPYVRLYRINAVPTGGTALTTSGDVGSPSGAAETAQAFSQQLQDASADGTNSTTALAISLEQSVPLASRWLARMQTLAGVSVSSPEPTDLTRGLPDKRLPVAATGHGFAVRLEAPAALVAGDFHVFVTWIWQEYRLP